MHRWQLVACCAVVQIGALFAAAILFVAGPLMGLEDHREKRATGDLNVQAVRKQREKLISLRAELDRYGPHLNSQMLGVTVADKDVRMNLLFEQLGRLASESGVSIRSFERAGHGLNSDGFAQVSFDTNFLQMSTFVRALSEASVPFHVMEFSARQVRDSRDKISFSLIISLAALETLQASICVQ